MTFFKQVSLIQTFGRMRRCCCGTLFLYYVRRSCLVLLKLSLKCLSLFFDIESAAKLSKKAFLCRGLEQSVCYSNFWKSCLTLKLCSGSGCSCTGGAWCQI